jgi:hypothetical protein
MPNAVQGIGGRPEEIINLLVFFWSRQPVAVFALSGECRLSSEVTGRHHPASADAYDAENLHECPRGLRNGFMPSVVWSEDRAGLACCRQVLLVPLYFRQ